MNLPNVNDSNLARQKLDHLAPSFSPPPNYFYPYEEDESTLLDHWRTINKRKWQIFLFTLLGVMLALGVSLILPNKYKAEASLMPIINSNNGGGLAAVSAQVGSIPGLGALGDLSKLGNGKAKELVNILKSRTLAEKIINHFDLLKIIFVKQFDPKTNTFHPGFPKFMKPIPVMEDGVSILKKKYIEVSEEKKTGLIKIQVTMNDPEIAAKIANAMIVELQEFIEANSLTTAKRNRIFIEEQLVKIKTKLLNVDKELNQFYGNNKISSVIPQVDVDVGTYQVMPKLFQEFGNDFLEEDAKKETEVSKESPPVKSVPGQVYLQFLSLNRDLLVKTFALLTQQYEYAKIDEAKEDLAFQVVDKAKVKVRPSSPRLLLNLFGGFAGGLCFGLFLAFFQDNLQKMKEKEISQR